MDEEYRNSIQERKEKREIERESNREDQIGRTKERRQGRLRANAVGVNLVVSFANG